MELRCSINPTILIFPSQFLTLCKLSSDCLYFEFTLNHLLHMRRIWPRSEKYINGNDIFPVFLCVLYQNDSAELNLSRTRQIKMWIMQELLLSKWKIFLKNILVNIRKMSGFIAHIWREDECIMWWQRKQSHW